MSENAETKKEPTNGGSVITEQERELAQNALSEFQRKSYLACLSYLNKLETIRPKDVKVMHNKIVAEYHRSELRKTELFAKSLNAICGSAKTTPDTPLDAIDDVEKCVMRYNQAILLFHSGQYEAALRIINRLFTFVEPMEESLAHKVSLLLIQLLIATKRPDAALSIVNYVESQFVSTDPGKLGAAADKETVLSASKSSSSGTKEKKRESSGAVTEGFRIQLLKNKLRIQLMLQQQPQLLPQKWKTLFPLGAQLNLSSTVLKANLECERGNYKESLRLLNSMMIAPDFKSCSESPAVIYYNNMACVYRALGKPNLAAFYLRKALEENEKAMYSLKSKDETVSNQALHTLGADKHHKLMFNLGESLLYANQPTKAFDCFTEAAQRLHNSPQLWLRMAECCIQCHKSTNAADFDLAKRRADLVHKVVGTGRHRKIVLEPALSNDSKYHPESISYAIPLPTLEFAMLCLKNALSTLPLNEEESSSLPISCPIIPTSSATASVAGLTLSGGLASAVGPGSSSEAPNRDSPPIQPSTLLPGSSRALDLRLAVLAASAYVSLCLGDYILALEHAKTMLSFENLPGAYRMLGNLYAAESLILMDKTNEAVEHLKIHDIRDLEINFPVASVMSESSERDMSEESFPKPKSNWFPSSLQTAKATVKYNLAAAYAIRGEFDKSGEILKQVWLSKGPDCDIPIHVIMLALYIELQLGNADVSRSIVKQHCPQYWC